MRHLAVALVLAPAALTAAAADPVFDSTPWIADLDQVRSAFLTKYANLEWAEAAARMLTSTRLRSMLSTPIEVAALNGQAVRQHLRFPMPGWWCPSIASCVTTFGGSNAVRAPRSN